MRIDFRLRETLHRLRCLCEQHLQQPLAMLIHIDQREGHKMPLVVLHDSSIAHPGIAEDALQDAKRLLHLRPHSRLIAIPAPLLFVHLALVILRTTVGHVLRLGRGLADNFRLPLIAAIAPYFPLIAVQ